MQLLPVQDGEPSGLFEAQQQVSQGGDRDWLDQVSHVRLLLPHKRVPQVRDPDGYMTRVLNPFLVSSINGVTYILYSQALVILFVQ